MIELRTLGQLAILCDGRHVPSGPRKESALLVYLAAARGRVLRRAQLLELLWDSSDAKLARHSLSQTLYGLRRRLGELPIEVVGDEIWLPDSTVLFDAAKFETAAAQGSWHEAAELYRGAFLEGFFVKRARAFDEWQEARRCELDNLARAVFRRLLDDAEAGGDWLQVQRWAERLLALDPFDEDLHRRRLRAIAATGERERALREFDRLAAFLSDQLGHGPQPETHRLVVAIRSANDVASPSSPPDEHELCLPFVGRRSEFARLQEEWAAVRSGSGRTLFVLGEAGIGKTRLCRHFLRLVAIQGGRILQGRCNPSDCRTPYMPLTEALSDSLRPTDLSTIPPGWAAVLGQLLPELAPHPQPTPAEFLTDPAAGQHRLFEAVVRLLAELARPAPLVLFLDDFHSADESTAALTSYLSHKSADLPTMILLALRPEDLVSGSGPDDFLRNATRNPSARRISLSHLDSDSVRSLLEHFEVSFQRPLPRGLRSHIIALTAGRPYFLIEILKAIRSGHIPVDESSDVASSTTFKAALPQSIHDFLRSRFSALSPAALRLLEALAVIGRRTDPATLRTMLREPNAPVLAAIDELLRKGIIADRDGAIGFAHDLLHETAYASIPIVRRRVLHDLAARAIQETRSGESAAVAVHHDLAGNRPAAYRWALHAARAATRVHAYAESEYFLRMAIANATDPGRRHAAEAELGHLLFRLGRYADAEPLLLKAEAHQLASGRDRAALFTRVERLSIHVARRSQPLDALLSELLDIAAAAERRQEYRTLVTALRLTIAVGHDLGRQDALLSIPAKLMAVAQLVGCPRIAAEALRAAANCLALYQAIEDAREPADRAVAVSRNLDPASHLVCLNVRATVLMQAGELNLAAQDFCTALELAEQTASVAVRPALLSDYGALLAEQGEFGLAEHTLRQAWRYATDIESEHDILYVSTNLAQLRYERGKLDEAQEAARETMSLNAKDKAWWSLVAAWSILGLCALERGQFAEAHRCRREVLLRLEGREFLAGDVSYIEMFLARLAAAEGEERQALARLERVIAAYEKRDVLCRSRLELERARLLAEARPGEARRAAEAVRARALRMGARPLVAKADAILQGLGSGGWGFRARGRRWLS